MTSTQAYVISLTSSLSLLLVFCQIHLFFFPGPRRLAHAPIAMHTATCSLTCSTSASSTSAIPGRDFARRRRRESPEHMPFMGQHPSFENPSDGIDPQSRHLAHRVVTLTAYARSTIRPGSEDIVHVAYISRTSHEEPYLPKPFASSHELSLPRATQKQYAARRARQTAWYRPLLTRTSRNLGCCNLRHAQGAYDQVRIVV